MVMRVGNSMPTAGRRLERLAFSIGGPKSKVSSSSARCSVRSTSSKSPGLETGRAFVSQTRKTPSTALSSRGKISALKMFNGTTENEPATFARSRSRSHVQKAITVCPSSETTCHATAGASGNSRAQEMFSRNDRNNFTCSTISGTLVARK